MPAATSRRTVLFLCTGNYYRSRHAEEVFNHLAAAAGLGWEATSRGLALEFGVNNVGPMSRATQARLTALGIPHRPELRMPLPVSEHDLAEADLVVALKELEHRPLLAERFPAWTDRVEYWAVHDVDFAPPDEALPEIEGLVETLVARLAAGAGPDAAAGPAR
jgi:protein-tyrosine phosphatase